MESECASRHDRFVAREGISGALSTLPNSAVLFPDWKQEINRRVAAHKNARGASQSASTTPATAPPLGTNAAKAAARVAARFASAPTYSEMLAREARAAVDAAKAAARAAEQAQAAFQFVLDGLEAAPVTPDWQRTLAPEQVLEPTLVSLAPKLLHDLPERISRPDAGQVTTSAAFGQAEALPQQEQFGAFDSAANDVNRRHELPRVAEQSEEAVKPIYANLIEFPRPMVAVRKARPRLAEGPLAGSDSAPQLSIFEVDPAAISIAPPPPAEDPSAPPSWMRTEWPALSDQEWLPARDSKTVSVGRHSESTDVGPSVDSVGAAEQHDLNAQTWEEISADFWPEDQAAGLSAPVSAIEVAPLSRRLLAVVVDGALSTAMLVLSALMAVPHVSQLPSARMMALGVGLAFLVAGLAYHACFFTLFRSTPGMRYAGIEMDTLFGSVPGHRRRWSRLLAMLLSLLPLGLGFLWALFDDDNLAWHDRLSGTYLRRR